jgi:RNA polymerase sigma-70 factor (ECF subfamily)
MGVVAAPDEPSTEALVTAAAAGDRRAEGTLCHKFAPAVRTFWRRRLRGNDAIDEATQDVFLRFVQALRSGAVTEPARVGGFILGICRNLARERARSQERRTELWEQFKDVLVSLDDEPGVARYQVAQLEDCLSQMTNRSRDVIRHAYVDGQSASEIATKLAMSEGNVRVVRHRALEALRDCMGQKIFWEAAS